MASPRTNFSKEACTKYYASDVTANSIIGKPKVYLDNFNLFTCTLDAIVCLPPPSRRTMTKGEKKNPR